MIQELENATSDQIHKWANEAKRSYLKDLLTQYASYIAFAEEASKQYAVNKYTGD